VFAQVGWFHVNHVRTKQADVVHERRGVRTGIRNDDALSRPQFVASLRDEVSVGCRTDDHSSHADSLSNSRERPLD
jgi:hypothetical protein